MNGGNITDNQPVARSVRAALILSLGLMIGCASTPVGPQTTIYRSGLNHVYLETDPDSISNDHPTQLTSTEIGSLLRGVRVWKQRNFLHRLYSGEPERTRAFRNEEVAELAPSLSKALEIASADQRVSFHLSHVTEHGQEETTTGWLSIRRNLLYLDLSEVHDRHGPGPDISKYDREMPNVPEQAPAFQATFEPEEYLHRVRSGWRLFTTNQREELQIRYREALEALTKAPRS